MALPTAQLGALGNMSMPYSIPTYEQGPGILEKALGALLVNAASGAAQRGTENLMSRDYAGEFGEKPATGFGRLLGPRVNEAQAGQRRQQSFTAGENTKERDFNRDQTELKLLHDQGQFDAGAANARLRQGDAAQASMDQQQLADMNALVRGDRSEAGQTSRNTADNEARMREIELQNKGRRELPSEQINQVIIDRLRGQTGLGGSPAGGPTTVAGVINPNIANYAKGVINGTGQNTSRGYDMPAAPDFVSNETDIGRMLAEGRSPEEIIKIVQRQQATNTAAQALPEGSTTPQVPVADPRVQELMRQLGLSSGYNSDIPVFGDR